MMNSNLNRLDHPHFGRVFALEDAAGIDAGLAIHFNNVRSIAHQPASFGIHAVRVDRGHPVARRERSELGATLPEWRAGADQECLDPLLSKARKIRIYIEIRFSHERFDLHSEDRSCRPHIRDMGLSARRVRIDQDGKARGSRHQFNQEPEPLWSKLQVHRTHAGDIAAGPAETRDQS